MKCIIWLFFSSLILLTGCHEEIVTFDSSTDRQPVALIEQITPVESYEGEPVSFRGYGTDEDGLVIAYKWYSDLDGALSVSARYEIDTLSQGTHNISFKVQDDAGQWSDPVLAKVTVLRRPHPPEIQYFRATPGRIGLGDMTLLSWYVSGAATVFINEGTGNVPQNGTIGVSPVLNTTYTLTASNEGGSSSADVSVIVIPSRVGLPQINSFTSNPGHVTFGESADLSWDVVNADSVIIDPAIGAVDPAGSVRISPELTTTYTLTAYNGTGLTTVTTQVLVSQSTAEGNADLVLTGVARVESEEGLLIEYVITNQGENDAPPSTTRLYANGLFRALDTLGPVPAGSSQTRQITGWLYDPSTSVIEISADADNVVAESDETNNRKTVFFPVRTIYDFIENAPDAQWSGAYPPGPVIFGETGGGDSGRVTYSGDAVLENASGPGNFLETRPRAAYGGWVVGDYSPEIVIKPGCYFYALVGLQQDAFAGDVIFKLYIRKNKDTEWTELSSGVYDWYDYKIKPMVIPIPPQYFGEQPDFRLRVNTNGEPFQDWAVWVQAKLIR